MSEIFRKYKQIDAAKAAMEAAAAQKRQKEETVIHEAMNPPSQAPVSGGGNRVASLAVVALALAVGTFGLVFKLALDVSDIQSNFQEMQVVVDDRTDESTRWIDHTTAVEEEFRRGFKKDQERLDALDKSAQATVEALASLKDVARAADIEKVSNELKEQKDASARLQQRIDNIVKENKKLADQLQAMQPAEPGKQVDVKILGNK